MWWLKVKTASQMDVALWCYKWVGGLDGYLWVGWGIEHLMVLTMNNLYFTTYCTEESSVCLISKSLWWWWRHELKQIKWRWLFDILQWWLSHSGKLRIVGNYQQSSHQSPDRGKRNKYTFFCNIPAPSILDYTCKFIHNMYIHMYCIWGMVPNQVKVFESLWSFLAE